MHLSPKKNLTNYSVVFNSLIAALIQQSDSQQNQEKLSSGSFLSCSEVVRDLTCMEYTKSLSSIERTILMRAKRLLLDEFSIIKNISLEEAECIVNRLLERE